MAIDEKYKAIIEQCERRLDKLNDWEQKFIMGDPENERSGPMRDRPYLSHNQKGILDRIVRQRFEGGKYDVNEVILRYGQCDAERTSEGWVIEVAGHKVGCGMVKREVPIITAWLDKALPEILRIPKDDLSLYLNDADSKTNTEDEEPF